MFEYLLYLQCWLAAAAMLFYGVRLYQARRRFLDVRLLAMASLVYFYALPGILASVSSGAAEMVMPLHLDDHSQVMMLAALPLTFIFFWFGLHLRLHRPPAVSPAATAPAGAPSNGFHLFGAALVLLVIGTWAAWNQLAPTGSIFSVVEGGPRGYLAARLAPQVGFFGVLTSLIPVSVLALLIWALERRQLLSGMKLGLILALFLFGVFVFSLLTVRHNIAMLVIGLCALLESRRPLLARRVIPAMLVGLLIGATSLQVIRTAGTEKATDFTENLANFVGSLEHLRVGGHVIQNTNQIGYGYADHALDLPIFMIPRSTWPDKPVTSTLNRRFWPEFAAQRTEKVPGLLAEGYASFGLFGVALFAWLFGLMVRYADAWALRSRSNELYAVLLLATLCGWAYSVVRIGLAGKHIITFLLMLAQVELLVRMAGSRKTSHALRQSPRPQRAPVPAASARTMPAR